MKKSELRKVIAESMGIEVKEEGYYTEREREITEEDYSSTQGTVGDEEIATILEDTLDTIYDLGVELDSRKLIKMFHRALTARAKED